MSANEATLVVINFTTCVAIVWACLCRLNSITCKLHKLVRLHYVMILAASAVAAFQPRPTPGAAILALAILASLALSAKRWTKFDKRLGDSGDTF